MPIMTESETLTMRPTVIGGQRCPDDYQVMWRGMSIGRIMRASGLPSDKPQWSWNCYVQGRPCRPNESGGGISLDQCKERFRAAWESIRAELTDQDIATAQGYAERSAEALARYDKH
jgi:hypothetical protein